MLVRSNLGGLGGRCDSAGLCTELQKDTTPREIYLRNVGRMADSGEPVDVRAHLKLAWSYSYQQDAQAERTLCLPRRSRPLVSRNDCTRTDAYHQPVGISHLEPADQRDQKAELGSRKQRLLWRNQPPRPAASAADLCVAHPLHIGGAAI